ncbi:MAG: hypothetical protein JO210_01405 [Acidobacteriaceae bacterium]|nr:hypothetical protein [Acidobacteriaceae bacterium]
MSIKKQSRERGSAFIEFLFTSLIWLPLLLGTILFGINLVKAIEVSQLSRDSGHMYAYGIDFTQPQNVPILQHLAGSLSIQQHGGAGAVVLSKITLVTDGDCAAANMKVCPNDGKYVFTNIFVFGNLAYANTKLGNPNASYYTNGTSIQAAQYLSDPSLVATNFSNLLTFPPGQSGQYAYVSEVTLDSQSINWSSFTNSGSYARSIF